MEEISGKDFVHTRQNNTSASLLPVPHRNEEKGVDPRIENNIFMNGLMSIDYRPL